MKVLHQIGKKIHGLIHGMAATQEADFVESFDALWEGVSKIYFPLLIMLPDQSMVVGKIILMIIVHHQMITFRDPLHTFFVYNTLMH